nr:phosphotransferase [Streptomyces roseicoloratus]
MGSELHVGLREQSWRAALTLPEPPGPHVWRHGDLKPTNLLAREGRLHAVIDSGGLSIGFPTPSTPRWGTCRHKPGKATGTP